MYTEYDSWSAGVDLAQLRIAWIRQWILVHGNYTELDQGWREKSVDPKAPVHHPRSWSHTLHKTTATVSQCVPSLLCICLGNRKTWGKNVLNTERVFRSPLGKCLARCACPLLLSHVNRTCTGPGFSASRLTTRLFFWLERCGHSPYVTFSLTRRWGCLLWIAWPFVKCTYRTYSMLLNIFPSPLSNLQSIPCPYCVSHATTAA
jgi:hypothetical protein